MKKIYSKTLLALLAVASLTGCERNKKDEPLPAARLVDNQDYSVANSSITSENFAKYANRSDVHYIDLRDSASYNKAHLEGFECIPFFDYIYDKTSEGNQLFYSVDNQYQSRYAESVTELEGLLPKNEVLFLMCQSGGRVATCMQIMDKFGWDMSKVYNIGGMNQYLESEFIVKNPVAEGTQLTAQTSTGQKATTSKKLVKELPNPKVDENGDYSVTNSSITSANLADYVNRSDVRYIDLRDQANYNKEHLKEFELIPFFDYILDQSADHSGVQLFYKDGENFVARYAESVDILKGLFPQDETIFFMCQSGGRVATCMKILEQFGWDMVNIYNVGGMNQYADSALKVSNQVAKDATVLSAVK